MVMQDERLHQKGQYACTNLPSPLACCSAVVPLPQTCPILCSLAV